MVGDMKRKNQKSSAEAVNRITAGGQRLTEQPDEEEETSGRQREETAWTGMNSNQRTAEVQGKQPHHRQSPREQEHKCDRQQSEQSKELTSNGPRAEKRDVKRQRKTDSARTTPDTLALR